MLVRERLVESYPLLSSPPDIKGIVHTNENSLIVYSVCVCVVVVTRGHWASHLHVDQHVTSATRELSLRFHTQM